MQLHAGSIDDLATRCQALARAGIEPLRSMNHRVLKSLSLRNPDANTVELTTNNFATLDELRSDLRSATFCSNPSSHSISMPIVATMDQNG